MSTVWDFDVINETVPIEDVLAFHGIYPERGKYRLRDDDDTPSASIHPQKKYGNIVHDFGYGNSFSPLSLTMFLQGVDVKEAARILGEAFHVPPKWTDKDEYDPGKISDYDWKAIGIHPDMASKNIDFDIERYGVAATARLSERFRMSMSELRDMVRYRKDTPEVDAMDVRRYEGILRNRALPYVYEQRDLYYRRMHDDLSTARAVNPDVELDVVYSRNSADYSEMAKRLTKVENVLKRVLDGTSVKFYDRRYRADKDFEAVAKGEVAFEIGDNTRWQVNDFAYKNKCKLFETTVSVADYYRLCANGLDTLMTAARQKGDLVKVYFSSGDSEKVNYLIRALRGKESSLADIVAGEENEKQNEAVDVSGGDRVFPQGDFRK